MKFRIVCIAFLIFASSALFSQNISITDTTTDTATKEMMVIRADNSHMIFSIDGAGKVTLGEGVTNDEAAKAFWKEVSKYAPCRK